MNNIEKILTRGVEEIIPKDEFKRIIIHGVLHLIGYDDQTDKDKSKMTELENLYMSQHKMDFYS